MSGMMIDLVIAFLEIAKVYAVGDGFDLHFLSDIDHLIATARANKD